MSQETTKALNVVQEMLTAFGKGDMEALKKTLSDDTTWVYHGVNGIPYNGTYQGKDGAVKFIMNIMANVDVLDFQVTKIVAEQNTVIVLGSEKQKIERAGVLIGINAHPLVGSRFVQYRQERTHRPIMPDFYQKCIPFIWGKLHTTQCPDVIWQQGPCKRNGE